MKENSQTVLSAEMRKNLIAGALAGGMLGMAFGIGLGNLLIGLAVGILLGLAIGYRLTRMPLKMRYPIYMTRRMLLTGALTMLVTLGYATLLDLGLTQTQLILSALVPTAAGTAFIVTIGMSIASLDELQRRIQTEAIAIGFAGTAILCLGYTLVGLAGVPPVSWGYVIVVMLFMWLVGKLWTMWRYR